MPFRRVLSVAGCLVVVFAVAVTGAPAAVDAQVGPTGPLRWRACGGGFECATLSVPRDDAQPDGPTVSLALVRAPARDPEQRIGSLVVNPGGPGGSAVDYVRGSARALPSELRDRFDIVGVDPRGSGQSDPIRCRFDMARYYALDFSPDDAAERAALVTGIQEYVDACVAAEGDDLRYVSTDATVRDLDKVRAALGDDRLTFLGYSYGTYIGAKYAAAFPDRVRALVLDGAVDPSIESSQMQVEQARGFEAVLDAFLKWCTRTKACAFHRGAGTAAALDRLRARVDAEGLTVPGARPARTLSPTEFDLGLAAILYEGATGYPYLGDALAAADRGDGDAMALLADSYTERSPNGAYGGIEDAFLAISCADGPPVGTVADVAEIEAAAAKVAPRLGPGIVNNSIACALWPFAGAPATPVAAPGAPPIVVIGTRRDPATPFAWAKALARQLGSGVLVSAPGTQHTSFGMGNRCVDDAVVRYLVDGQAPKGTLTC
ncbi:MAG: alpha/beta hydrolase [Actinomycetota bacterium]